jgi:membrane-associated phospholipid phosphatase
MTEPTDTDIRTDQSQSDLKKRHWLSNIFRLRIEEFLALLFFAPMVYLTAKAYLFFAAEGHVSRRFVGGVQRAIAVVIVVGITALIARFRPNWKVLRDGLPFAFCIAIYTNLHDTIHFANPHDIHDTLIAIDGWLFGVQPCVWAQQFVRPWLTEILSFCYMLFFLWSPLLASVLYFQGKKTEFRYTLASIILCFYAGYILYVAFPAVPPRITLEDLFTVKFDGTPIADAAQTMINVLPSHSRAAFPSLHAAVTLVTLLFAWKYARLLFWLILPFCTGLLISTIYLRHHYAIDLIAGFALGILAFMYGPRIEAWWQSHHPDRR